MICTYEIRVKGADHENEGKPCQDACRVIKRDRDDLVIAAVADGAGSENRSDIGSRIAVDVAIHYCDQHIVSLDGTDDILQIIRAAFFRAQDEIEKEAEVQCHNGAQYHTTLSLAVLLGNTLYYGHSGDSGIIALTTEGLFEKVTEQQRDDGGDVFFLFFEKKRVFGRFDKNVCSVLLSTDGMLDGLFIPRILANEPVNINTYATGFFVGDWKSRIDKQGENAVISQIENYVRNKGREVSADDLTVVGLINTAVACTLQPDDYYKEPDWEELKRKYAEENPIEKSKTNVASVDDSLAEIPGNASANNEAVTNPQEDSGATNTKNI